MKVSLIKPALFSAAMLFAGLATFSLSSCEEDKCKSIVCAYGGVCDDGACVCQTGYEGPQCETINRMRFLDVWIVTEDGTISNASQYGVSVKEGTAVNEVVINNFYNSLLNDVKARVKGDTLIIPLQTVNNHEVQGQGYITDDKYYGDHGKLVVRYTVKDPVGNVDDFGVGSESTASIWNK